MANSSVDLQNAGLLFQTAGLSINQKVHDNIQTLDFHQIQELSNKAQDLFIKSKAMFAQAVITISDEAKDALQSIVDAKDSIDDVIKHVNKIQDIINFAADLVTAASSILSGDVGKIISNGQTIVTDIQNLNNSK